MDDSLITDRTPLLVGEEQNDEAEDVVRHEEEYDFVKTRLSADSLLLNCDETDDEITAIFVVSFDTRSGNLIEWCYPNNVDIEGIEFKAITSGAHKVKTDFVYFKQDDLYGLSCFENMPVQSNVERGARMKSVGILSKTYKNLFRHINFLQSQVRVLLEFPGSYDQLSTYFSGSKTKVQSSLIMLQSYTDVDSVVSQHNTYTSHSPNLDIMKSIDSFRHFINFFGVEIFILWKLVLLQKRILFFSPPPLGMVCYRVHCASRMSTHQVHEIKEEINHPLFSINLNDIELLEKKSSYIACTSEKVFELKSSLYDVFVDNQNINICDKKLRKATSSTSSDHKNFKHLKSVYDKQLSASNSGDFESQSYFIKFFSDLNNRLFNLLLRVSHTNDRQLTSEHLSSIGLDASSDQKFLMEVIELYGFDIVYVVDNSCCPICPLMDHF